MKYFILVAIFFSLYIQSIAQCGTSGATLTLTTQAEVDDFDCEHFLGNLRIQGGSDIDNLNGLSELTTIDGYFTLHLNYALPNLAGLENLTSIGSFFDITYSQGLTSLLGISNLNTIGGGLRIFNNQNLLTLDGLSGLNSIDGTLEISNTDIDDLSGLEQIDHNTINQLIILGNTYLCDCDIQNVCDYLSVSSNNATIATNATGCDTRAEVEGDCINTPCGAVGTTLVLKSQAEVDAFNCTTVEGNLTIGGSDISSLSGLSNLTTINGNLSITNNPMLTSLDGLEALIAIDGELSLYDNHNLTSIGAIGDLDYTTISNLEISRNFQLSICNFQNICDYIENNSSNGSISQNSTGCDTYAQIEGECFAAPCGTVDMITSITTQGEVDNFNCSTFLGDLIISGNDITNLDGFAGLEYIQGDLTITYNANLVDVGGLSDLTTIDGELDVVINSNLENLDGLSALSTVGGRMTIFGNNMLSSVALSMLTTIGDDLTISYHPILSNLNGLSALNSINGDLELFNNDALVDISGLSNLSSTGISNLFIRLNDNLDDCAIASICDYLANSENNASFILNEVGCNTRTEVETACSALPVELTTFSGKPINKSIQLHWQTTSETNNKGFQLQKSKDGINWQELAFIQGKGTSATKNNYQYTDAHPFEGTNYYRLKQIDFDGAFDYSEVVSVRIENTQGDLLIYPNPVEDRLMVAIQDPENLQNASLQILNLNGQVLLKKKITDSKQFSIDVSNLPSNVYLIELKSDAMNWKQRFLKQ